MLWQLIVFVLRLREKPKDHKMGNLSSVNYFSNFLGDNPDIEAITGNDLRRFIIGLQDTHKLCHHPFNKPQQAKPSPQSINTYCRAIRAFFGYLYREDLIESNPMERRLRCPRYPGR